MKETYTTNHSLRIAKKDNLYFYKASKKSKVVEGGEEERVCGRGVCVCGGGGVLWGRRLNQMTLLYILRDGINQQIQVCQGPFTGSQDLRRTRDVVTWVFWGAFSILGVFWGCVCVCVCVCMCVCVCGWVGGHLYYWLLLCNMYGISTTREQLFLDILQLSVWYFW